MPVVAGAAIIGGATIYSARKAGKSADKAASAQAQAAELQYDISQQQIDLAKEQWNIYKDKVFPLEIEAQKLGIDARELAQQRGELDFGIYEQYYAPMSEQFATEAMEGIEAQPERAAREARLSVDKAFDTEEGMIQRNLERRGVRPGSGAYTSAASDTSLNRAAAKGFSVNRAVELERDRVEDVNFNRKAVALGRQPLAQGAAQGAPGSIPAGLPAAGLAGAGNTAFGAGSQFGSVSRQYGDAASNIMSGGIQLGMGAYDLYNKYKTPSTDFGFNTGGGSNFAAGGGYGTVPGSEQSLMLAEQNMGFAEGGPVQAPTLQRSNAYAEGGQVNGPPGYDKVPASIQSPDGSQYPAQLTDGEYVIPADVVKVMGTGPLDDIIEKARMRKEKANQSPNALRRMH